MIKQYVSSDLCLIAYLLYEKYQIADVKRDGNKCSFFIMPHPENKVIDDYYSGRAVVNPVDFYLSVKNVKNMIYNWSA